MLAVPACIIGAALTPVLVGLFASKRAGYGMVDVVYGSLATAALWIYAAGIKERKKIEQSISEMPATRSLLTTSKNRPFQRLIGAYLLANTVFALMKILMAYPIY